MNGSSLPAVMQEIAEAAGMEAAWALVRAYGGTTIYIPRHALADHWLTELVGQDAADKICRQFSVGNTGVRILIPLARQGQQQARLIKAIEAGMSASQAASASGMHERTVFRARQRMREQQPKDERKPARKKPDDRQVKLL